MRQYLLIGTLLVSTCHVSAQINAGDVPPGASVYEPNIQLFLNTPFTTDSAAIDIDCERRR